jgi:excisionase family DNA binding protein
MPKTLTTYAMAKLLGVSSRTVRRRIEDGTIKATRASNGRFYISQREADRIASR